MFSLRTEGPTGGAGREGPRHHPAVPVTLGPWPVRALWEQLGRGLTSRLLFTVDFTILVFEAKNGFENTGSGEPTSVLKPHHMRAEDKNRKCVESRTHGPLDVVLHTGLIRAAKSPRNQSAEPGSSQGRVVGLDGKFIPEGTWQLLSSG